MKLVKYKIQGLYKIKPKIYYDNRGYFFESYNSNKFNNSLIKDKFVQDNHSFSKKNVLRGIHFQYKNPQSQLFYLASGKIYLVVVDFRPNSKTFLKKQSFILDSKKHEQIYMSPGLGSGFLAISDKINLLYKVSKIFSRDNEIAVIWNDPLLKINWPIKKPIISKKDLKNFYIEDIDFKKFKDLCKL
tara:strand:+ start:15457 stop:16017 length:561 start_codon:yes stop_codon:yes gene_type:complete